MKTIDTISRVIKDYTMTPLVPLRSLVTYLTGGRHHIVTENIKHKTLHNNLAKKTSRNIYLSDLDDTFINWKVAERSTLWKIVHRFSSRPSTEAIEIFDHAENLVSHLNKQNIHTAIISNKEHKKLLAQAEHHPWSGLFDRLFGHDRERAFTLAKMPKSALPKPLRYSKAAYPIYIIEQLLNEKPKRGMEPVKVIFVGDKIGQDVLTANILDKALKKFNPESSCTSVLFNSRRYPEYFLNTLPADKAPKEVVSSYAQLQKITDRHFGIEKLVANSTAKDDKAESQQKPIKAQEKAKNWIDYITEQQITQPTTHSIRQA